MNALYDKIGARYSRSRKSDPWIASKIYSELKDSFDVLNIGAGTGSYEPPSVNLVALEPSSEMIRQRKAASNLVCKAKAEHIPFTDNSFSHTMTILSMHHWQNRKLALDEIKRVTKKRFIAVTWDPDKNLFWLTRDYFPQIYNIDRLIFPEINEFYETFEKVTVKELLIPAQCQDGFMAAYWRRPEAYLDKKVRDGISTFQKIPDISDGLNRLEQDLKNGIWQEKYSDIMKLDFIDVGYKIIVVDF